MKKFFKKHQEIALIGLTIILVAAISVYFVWGIKAIIVSVNESIGSNGAAGTSGGFNLKGAQGLDLKGLPR